MKRTRHLFFIPVLFTLLLSCGGDDGNPEVTDSPFSNFDEFEVYRPLPEGTQLVENGLGPQSALIDGESIEFHSARVYGGQLFYEIRFDGAHSVKLRLRHLKPGIFAVNENSGFTRAFLDGQACSTGEIRLIEVDEVNQRISGNYSFAARDSDGNLVRVSSGQFSNVSFDELTPVNGVFTVSARVNGKPWTATVYDCFKGAASFAVTGYNEVGNVALAFSSSYWTEEGERFALNENEMGMTLQTGKTTPTFIDGNFSLNQNDQDRFVGRFEARFEGYVLRGGIFSFEFR